MRLRPSVEPWKTGYMGFPLYPAYKQIWSSCKERYRTLVAERLPPFRSKCAALVTTTYIECTDRHEMEALTAAANPIQSIGRYAKIVFEDGRQLFIHAITGMTFENEASMLRHSSVTTFKTDKGILILSPPVVVWMYLTGRTSSCAGMEERIEVLLPSWHLEGSRWRCRQVRRDYDCLNLSRLNLSPTTEITLLEILWEGRAWRFVRKQDRSSAKRVGGIAPSGSFPNPFLLLSSQSFSSEYLCGFQDEGDARDVGDEWGALEALTKGILLSGVSEGFLPQGRRVLASKVSFLIGLHCWMGWCISYLAVDAFPEGWEPEIW